MPPEVEIEVAPGFSSKVWAYNGQVPGPLLHVKEGDEVEVTVHNFTTLNHTIHWHGVYQTDSWQSDGVPDVSQKAIEPGEEFTFESKIVGGNVPKEYIPGVQKGLESAKENGLLAGFPLIDFKATLIDGAYHDVDSSVLAFEIAARAAFKELREKGAPKLLEPIMAVEVVTPEEYLGSVIGDLNGRRGMIQGQDVRGNAIVVDAFVPLANMFGYVNNLRGMSQGRAAFTMQYDHYDPVPQHVADEVIKKYA